MDDRIKETHAFEVSKRFTSRSILVVAVVSVVSIAIVVAVLQLTGRQDAPATSSRKYTVSELQNIDLANSKTNEDKAYAYVRKANDLGSSGDLQGVLQAYMQADKIWPKQAFILGNIGNTYYQLKDKANAISYFEAAIKLVEQDKSSELKSSVAVWRATIVKAQNNDFVYTDIEGEQ